MGEEGERLVQGLEAERGGFYSPREAVGAGRGKGDDVGDRTRLARWRGEVGVWVTSRAAPCDVCGCARLGGREREAAAWATGEVAGVRAACQLEQAGRWEGGSDAGGAAARLGVERVQRRWGEVEVAWVVEGAGRCGGEVMTEAMAAVTHGRRGGGGFGQGRNRGGESGREKGKRVLRFWNLNLAEILQI